MSFAVALCSDPDILSLCPYLGPADHDALGSGLGRRDWREELVNSLGEDVAKLDLSGTAPGIGCFMKGDKLIVRCIGREYAVGSDGRVSPDTRNPWIKVLLLHYVRNSGQGDFRDRWVSFSELKSGFVKASTFRRECEEPLRGLLDTDIDRVAALLTGAGASAVKGFTTDHAWSLDLLPRVRTLILYRSGDEEFPSSLKMLFDAVTDQFIDVETLIFLCEGLVHTITGAGLS